MFQGEKTFWLDITHITKIGQAKRKTAPRGEIPFQHFETSVLGTKSPHGFTQKGPKNTSAAFPPKKVVHLLIRKRPALQRLGKRQGKNQNTQLGGNAKGANNPPSLPYRMLVAIVDLAIGV